MVALTEKTSEVEVLSLSLSLSLFLSHIHTHTNSLQGSRVVDCMPCMACMDSCPEQGALHDVVA